MSEIALRRKLCAISVFLIIRVGEDGLLLWGLHCCSVIHTLLHAIARVSLYQSVVPQQHAIAELGKERNLGETVNFAASRTASSTSEIISSLLFPK
jgi:hypothetical protein